MCEVTSVPSSQSPDDTNKKSSLFKDSNKEIPIVELTLEEVTYEPITSTIRSGKPARGSSKENRTTVLNKITTKISPYKLTAWMGPSGSGKV